MFWEHKKKGGGMDYKKFYLAVRRYRKGRITRGMFLIDWADAQRKQKQQNLQRTVKA